MLAMVAAILWEAGLGAASSQRGDAPTVPSLSLRVAHEDSFWSVGGRALALAGPEGPEFSNRTPYASGETGFFGWGLFAEAGLHTPGRLQLAISVAAGLGQLVRIQQRADTHEDSALEGKIGPVLGGSVAVRVEPIPSLWLGVEAGIVAFTRVSYAPNPIFPNDNPPNPPLVGAGQLLLTLGWSR